jgi:Domain of unknown function (DUF5710)
MIERLWLDVPFEDKEAAKAAGRPLGARPLGSGTPSSKPGVEDDPRSR